MKKEKKFCVELDYQSPTGKPPDHLRQIAYTIKMTTSLQEKKKRQVHWSIFRGGTCHQISRKMILNVLSANSGGEGNYLLLRLLFTFYKDAKVKTLLKYVPELKAPPLWAGNMFQMSHDHSISGGVPVPWQG